MRERCGTCICQHWGLGAYRTAAYFFVALDRALIEILQIFDGTVFGVVRLSPLYICGILKGLLVVHVCRIGESVMRLHVILQ